MNTALRFARPGLIKLGIFAVALMILGSALPARAHARLVRANPKDKAELAQSPGQIDLWFNELLDDGFNKIEVFPAAELTAKKRTNLAKEKPKLDAQDRTHLALPLPALTAGEYVVEWRVLSRDGHSAPGRLTFRIISQK